MSLKELEISVFSNGKYKPILDGQVVVNKLKQGYEVKNPSLEHLKLKISLPINKIEANLIYCNGFQSWSESRWYEPLEKIPQLSIIGSPVWKYFHMDKYGDLSWRQQYAISESLYSYQYLIIKNQDNFTVLGTTQTDKITVLGFNSDKKDCSIYLDLEASEKTDILIKSGSLFECQTQYFSTLMSQIPSFPSISGWTSWYQYFTNISPEILQKQLSFYKKNAVPISYFQIDDGWQKYIGDWTPNDKFTGKMKNIATEITEAGYVPGLWLAPFVVEKDALATMPESWIRNTRNEKIVAGRSLYWSGKFYALDIENSEVKEYLKKVFHKVIHDWGYKLLKLDFLYAANLQSESRQNYLAKSYDLLKEITKGADILGCGAIVTPDMPFKYLRIGADVAHIWEDKLLANIIQYRERVSSLASLRNTVSRALWNHYHCFNDPDVYFLKQRKLKLSDVQINTLFTLNYVLGTIQFTSDDLVTYEEKELNIFYKQFPAANKEISDCSIVKNDIGWYEVKVSGFTYLLVYNLSKVPETISLKEGNWCNQNGICKGQFNVDAYSCSLLKKFTDDCLIYSSGHIFPGLDIEQVEIRNNELIINRHNEARSKSELSIKLPDKKEYIEYNNKRFQSEYLNGMNIVKVHLPKRFNVN